MSGLVNGMNGGLGHKSSSLNDEQLEDLRNVFETIDSNGNGFIELSELGQALEVVDIRKAQWEVRKLVEDIEKNNKNGNKDGRLDLNEFRELYTRLKSAQFETTFKRAVKSRSNLEKHAGMTESSAEGTTHSVRHEEKVAFTNWINSNFASDPDLDKYNISVEGPDLYEKCKDGVVLCKLVNMAVPNTIDERTINMGDNMSTFKVTENLNLALNSSQAIGCHVINIGSQDLKEAKPHLVLGLLWQIIRIGLMSEIDLKHHPELVALLREGETQADLLKMGPEAILLRWVNYHLARAGVNREIKNFTSDITDSEAYIHLLNQIQPRDELDPNKQIHLHPLQEQDLRERAESMLCEADKLGCRSFVSSSDVVNGNYKLNLAFVANLFNKYPALDVDALALQMETIEENREEKTYRNWMNSMGVKPFVNYLYSDLCDGLIIFQLYDIIKAGTVDWSRVQQKFAKIRAFMQKIENCNYAVDLGKKGCKFSLVGIEGKDINDGNATLTLALVWQLMRAYSLSVLTNLGDGHPVVEKQVVEWAQDKLQRSGKSSTFRSFQDSALADGKVIIDLIDALRPGVINYNYVKDGQEEEERMENAKYAISMARKIGAGVYALPEDITEVNHKMIMTVFACLMVKDMQPKVIDEH